MKGAVEMAEDKTYTSTNIPPGGTAGQLLAKASNSNYHIKWVTGGGGGDGGSIESMTALDILNIIKANDPSFNN